MSDLDNEEIEATKKMLEKIKNTPDDVIKKAIDNLSEKTADEMFEELGYRRKQDTLKEEYIKENKKIIQFWKDKTISSIIKWCSDCIDYEFITMQELKAIYKYCEEKGWIECIRKKNQL